MPKASMLEDYDACWQAPVDFKLPDFIICGAMKCGTSTVRSLLAQHPLVSISPHEINFFDQDDILEHSDFFSPGQHDWIGPNIAKNPSAYWQWYSESLSEASENQLLGEDSTCYLPSRHAARRIALQEKPIKTIICLRHPTTRAYSQYWHMVRMNRAEYSFEDTIRFHPTDVLWRSLYKHQIDNFMLHIRRENIFFFVLEEFLEDASTVVGRLLDFLGLPKDQLPTSAEEAHENVAQLPRFIRLQLLKNRLMRGAGNERYRQQQAKQRRGEKKPLTGRLVNRFHQTVNPLVTRPAPAMKPSTRVFLDSWFEQELAGIDELTGHDLTARWFAEKRPADLAIADD